MKMEQNFKGLLLFEPKMIKVIQTLLMNRVFFSLQKKNGGKANNPDSPKNGFVLGGDISRADALSQPP